MTSYVNDHALNISLQLLQIISSGRSFSDRLSQAPKELHIKADFEHLKLENADLIHLLETIESEASLALKEDRDLLFHYFHYITLEGKDYESMTHFLFLTEDISEHLTAPDFASYKAYLTQMEEQKRCALFLFMLRRYNRFYLRSSEADEEENLAGLLQQPFSPLDVISAIMEMEVPLQIKWKIQDIFIHWKSHLAKALPLLEKTCQALLHHASELEPYAQDFLSYWIPKINDTGFSTFVEKLLPVVKVPETPLGYKLSISFFQPLELGLSVSLDENVQTASRPHELVMGIFYGEHLTPQNPYLNNSVEDEEIYLNALKQLSDKRRFEILSYLSLKPAYASELVKFSGLTAATISHHMSQLAEASLIRLEKIDTKVYYSLNEEMIRKCLDYCEKKLLHH